MSPQILCRVTYGNPRPPAAITAHMTVRPALLPGFKRHRVKYVDYPAIVPHPEATAEEDGVRGTVVTGLTDVMVMKLDHFEGDMYERRHVEVLVLDGEGKGERVRVETYVWQKARSGLEEKEWDFDEFMREKASYWIDVEREDYVDADTANDDHVLEEERDVMVEDITKATEESDGSDDSKKAELLKSAA